jgi:hypothetical protein
VNFEAAEKIAKAVLYEGYMLYPYRPSALKNQQRWTFGTLYPPNYEEVRAGIERSTLHAECLLLSSPEAVLQIRARFLQLGDSADERPLNDSVERTCDCSMHLKDGELREPFSFAAAGGEICGSLRVQCEQISPPAISNGAATFKLRMDLLNESHCEISAGRAQALLRALLSAHLMLGLEPGQFVSLLDPPPELRDAVAGCKNVGCFPVLVGDEQRRNMLLCSSITLYDFPQVAPESAGDFFDGTEMDEMLTLRVITMTDEEKQQMNSTDTRLRDLLDRTERTAREQLMRTHGTIRSMRPVSEHE